MKSYFVKLVIVMLLLGVSRIGDAQIINEDEVGLQVLKWHFYHYPNSETLKWKRLEENSLQVDFIFEEKNHQVIYLADGIKSIEKIDLSNDVPISVQYYLDEKYGKYKVQDFVRITDFEDDQMYYLMSLKVKDKGVETLSFDEHLIPVDFTLISSID